MSSREPQAQTMHICQAGFQQKYAALLMTCRLEAKPRDDICQRVAHLFRGWGTSVQTDVQGGARVCVCVHARLTVCAWVCVKGSSELTFTFLKLYSSPTFPTNFLHCFPFFTMQFYAALSDNTLEAILELISLIGNKLQLFLQLQTVFLSYHTHCWTSKWKECQFQLLRFLPLRPAWRDNNYCSEGR